MLGTTGWMPGSKLEREGRMTLRLNPRSILKLPHGENGRRDYRDHVVRGLTLRVGATERTWAFVYRSSGRVRRFTIGSAHEISLATARQRVRALRADLARGIDPQSAKVKEREESRRDAAAPRFRDLCDAFVADQSPDWRPSTRRGWLHHIKTNIKPILGDKRPADISGDDVRALIDGMARRVPVSARRAYEVLRRIFAWAAWKRYVPSSPCVTARPFETSKRSGVKKATRRFKAFTDEQIRAIFMASKGTELEPVVDLAARTAVRRHEILAARWEDIDFGVALWRVPAAMHKTGDETGEPHLVTLSTGAQNTLGTIRSANLNAGLASGWVFPAATTTCHVCEQAGHADPPNKVVKSVKVAAGIGDRGLLHRFRDTLKTRLSEHGTDVRVSEHILGHVVPGIAGIYDHAEMLPQRREALEWWSQELDRILAGPVAPAKVVPIAKGRDVASSRRPRLPSRMRNTGREWV